MIDKKFIASQKAIIVRAIDRLSKQIDQSKAYANIGSSNEDSALEFEVFEEKLALNKTREKELTELKRALERIKDGKYGFCTRCGEQIEAGRLKTYPEAEFCATHAKK